MNAMTFPRRAATAPDDKAAMQRTWARLDPDHKRAVRMLALTLGAGRALDFDRLAVVLHARLTEQERVKLAWAVLSSLEPEPREWVFNLAHTGAAG